MKEEAKRNRFHRIRSISVTGGFLDGLHLDFADGLNCLIGHRGTGKTTVLEFIRFALDISPASDNLSAARSRAQSLVENNLWGGRVQLAIETKEGLTYQVSRTLGEPPLVVGADGKPAAITLKSGSVFKADIYGQDEVEGIADDPLSQLALVDNCDAARIREFKAQGAQVEAKLDTNAQQTLPLLARRATLSEEVGTMDAVRERLKAFAPVGTKDDVKAVNDAYDLKARRDQEGRAVEEVGAFLQTYDAELEALQGRVEQQTEALFEPGVLDGPNVAMLKDMRQGLLACGTDVDRLIRQARDRIAREQNRLSGLSTKLAAAHAEQEMVFRGVIEKHKEAQAQSAERTRLEAIYNDLRAKQRALQETDNRLQVLATERGTLLQQLSELRDQCSAARRAVADQINARLRPTIRVTLVQFGNPRNYQELLATALTGQRMMQNLVAERIVRTLPPGDLCEAIRARKGAALIERAGLNRDQAEKVVAALSDEALLFQIETVELLDLPRIELRDGDTYKDSLALSTGQKCTTILPILLLDSTNPLLIDQPEDNLDNSFIYDIVQTSIRGSQRQLLFVTHNPNIPVLGDAAKVFVLDSDGASARKKKEGTVNDCRTDIMTLLEGGKQAFEDRMERYGY